MPKGISLHIGLNSVDPAHYAGWSGPLTACEADAEDMLEIARSRGYSSSLLLSPSATREAVVRGIGEAAASLAAGDIFFLSYSGHGGQVPDKNGDEPDDLSDETWCLYDGELLDDELMRLWPTFAPGVRVLVLSDSCHSGTATRAAFGAVTAEVSRAALQAAGIEGPVRFRCMPDDVALRTYRKHPDFYNRLQEIGGEPGEETPVAATVRLISGCQDNQYSADGAFNGLFTGTLQRVWNNGGFEGGYQAFHQAILRRMPPTQSPNHFLLGAHNPVYDAEIPFSI